MTPDREVLLEIDDLHTHIGSKAGTVAAPDGISLKVHVGETVGVVGESGSGKSMTALSILRVLPKPAANIVKGRILFEGEDLLTKSEREMRDIRGGKIAMILQDPQTSLNPLFRIGSQIIEALRIQWPEWGRSKLKEKAVEALRQVNVAAPEHRIEVYPHQMSGGMKQRVVGAIAISREPRLIIADEPTTSLDVTIQAQYLRLLQDLQVRKGLSILFITHDLGIVAQLCHRLVVMYAGRIVECGSVRAIFDKPSHPYTRALLESRPRIDAKVDRLISIEGQPPPLWNLPVGCRFANRCPHAHAKCLQAYPPSFTVKSDDGEEHTADCWLLEEGT